MTLSSSSRPKDMRTWIAQLDAVGELMRIDKPIDPLTEVGALLHQSVAREGVFSNNYRAVGTRSGRRRRTRAMQHYVQHQERNEPMPMAIFIDHHLLYYAAAATKAAYGLEEFKISGSNLGEAVRLVKCQTAHLEVPGDAEVALEGDVPPQYREKEWPFSEFQDYCVTSTSKNSIAECDHMMCRRSSASPRTIRIYAWRTSQRWTSWFWIVRSQRYSSARSCLGYADRVGRLPAAGDRSSSAGYL